MFLQLAQPDEEGFSRFVHISEMVEEFEALMRGLGNGGSWCRDDGSLKDFNIERIKEKGKIVAVKLNGIKKHVINKQIKSEIKNYYKDKKCAVLAVSNIEVDHKDGRRDSMLALNPKTQDIKDFQPLSKCVNNAKRQHCKVCRESGVRFDAKVLGYSTSQIKGSTKYTGSCVGCYWFDPAIFNKQISQDFKKIT